MVRRDRDERKPPAIPAVCLSRNRGTLYCNVSRRRSAARAGIECQVVTLESIVGRSPRSRRGSSGAHVERESGAQS